MHRENNHYSEKRAATPAVMYRMDTDNPHCRNILDILWDDTLSDIERHSRLSKAVAGACGEGFGVKKTITEDTFLQIETDTADSTDADVNKPASRATGEKDPPESFMEGINPTIIAAALYYEHNALLQRLISAVRSPSGMSQVVMFNERVTIRPYKDQHFKIRIKNRNLELIFYRLNQRAGVSNTIRNLQKDTAEKTVKISD